MAGDAPSGPSEEEQRQQMLENARIQKEASDRQAAVQAQTAQVGAISKTNTALEVDTSASNLLAKKKKAQQLSTGLNAGSLLG